MYIVYSMVDSEEVNTILDCQIYVVPMQEE